MKIKMIASSAGPKGVFRSGEIYDVDSEIAEPFVKGGYAEKVEEETADKEEKNSENEELKHVGGGYYELPNGDKVRGKDEALAALKELQEKGDE